MRKLALCLLSTLCTLAMAWPAAASTFSDVPTDHWAYDAIDYLQEASLVEGYPDGSFKGDRPFTRYEMAMVIARVFTKIQDWQAMYDEGTPPGMESIDLTEVYTRLDRLSEEFRDELSDLGARVTAVEDEQARVRGEVDDLKSLIKDSGLSGTARWRAGYFFSTGSESEENDPGYEQLITLNYKFKPEKNLDFNFSLTAAEQEGPAGTGYIPGANNETPNVMPANPPFGERSNSSSFIIDEAYFKYYMCNGPNWLGDCPVVTGGRHYFSHGEFGLAGDNGYRSNFGVNFETTYGRTIDAYAGYYRTESMEVTAPFANDESDSLQSSSYTTAADDMLLAGLEYHSGEGTVAGHDYKLVVRLDGTPNGYGAEQYVGLSGNVQLPWFSDAFLNGLRGEWVYVTRNASDYDPDADLGLTPFSFIFEVDLYNTEQTRVSTALGHMAQIEALPVLANIDNDPFSEWDYTVNEAADAFNLSREGRNYFPADFFGFGLQVQHTFGNSLHSTFTFYDGERIDANASDRPGMARLNLRYPFTNNSSLGLDLVAAGERRGLEDPIGLIRGEFKIHF